MDFFRFFTCQVLSLTLLNHNLSPTVKPHLCFINCYVNITVTLIWAYASTDCVLPCQQSQLSLNPRPTCFLTRNLNLGLLLKKKRSYYWIFAELHRRDLNSKFIKPLLVRQSSVCNLNKTLK